MTDIALNNETIPDDYRILLQSHKWQLVGTGEQSDLLPEKRVNAKRKKWSRENSKSHNNYEFLFCIKGSGLFGLEDKQYRFSPGTLVTVRPHVPHDDYYQKLPGKFEHIWFHILHDSILISWCVIVDGILTRNEHFSGLVHNSEIGINVYQLIEHAHLTEEESGLLASRIRWVFGAVAECLYRKINNKFSGKNDEQLSIQDSVIDAVCKHIEHTAGRDVSLDLLSHITGYSKFHLTRIFRKKTGMTIHDYIDKIRLERLAELRLDKKNNREIANTLGFSCPTAFLRWQRQIKKKSRKT